MNSMNESRTMDNAVNKSILRRIQKMLARAEHENANEHEAANAAAQAAALMARYNLTRAIVEAQGGERQVEPIDVEVVFTLPTKTLSSWFSVLARAVVSANNCKHFYDRIIDRSGPKPKYRMVVKAVGRETDRQAIKMLLEFVAREIERLSDLALAKRSCDCGAKAVTRKGSCLNCGLWREASKVFGNNFRFGCAEVIGERLREIVKNKNRGVIDEIENDDGDAKSASEVSPADLSQALVLLNRDREEVDLYYKDLSKREGLKTMASSSFRTSNTGRAAGREAGKNIHLGGQLPSSGSVPSALRGE